VWFAGRAFRRLRADEAGATPSGADGTKAGDLGRQLVQYSWPFAVWGVFGWAQVGGDRWILEGFEGSAAVASYAVISQLASFPLIFLTGILGMMGAPIAFARRAESDGREAARRARRAVWLLVGVFVAGALAVLAVYWAAHAWLVRLVSDPRYVSMSGLLPALTLGWTLYYLGQMLAQFGLLEGRSAAYIAPKVASAAVLVVLGLVLCPRYGAAGLVWAVGFSGAAYAAWCAFLAWRIGRPAPDAGPGRPA